MLSDSPSADRIVPFQGRRPDARHQDSSHRASEPCKMVKMGGSILPRTDKKIKATRSGLYFFAPRVGFEPTTYRLQWPLNYSRDWTISCPGFWLTDPGASLAIAASARYSLSG